MRNSLRCFNDREISIPVCFYSEDHYYELIQQRNPDMLFLI
jgi:hypothetical protein